MSENNKPINNKPMNNKTAKNRNINKPVNKKQASNRPVNGRQSVEKKPMDNPKVSNAHESVIDERKRRPPVRKKGDKTRWDEVVRKGLKHSSAFMLSLLINIIIVYFICRLFTYSFNFTYSVFGDAAKDPAGREYAVIEIPADSSTLQIGEALEDNNIIEDKYVFWAKVKIKKAGGKIKAGKYGLSSSMTYGEIINLICGIDEEEKEEGK